MASSSDYSHPRDHASTNTIEPGKDHYVRHGGKLLAILLASQYPTEWDLQQARHDYERGVDGAVVLSSKRSGEDTMIGESAAS